MAKNEIAFFWQGEEVYRIELPANATRVMFSDSVVEAYAGIQLRVPVVTSIECLPETGVDTE